MAASVRQRIAFGERAGQKVEAENRGVKVIPLRVRAGWDFGFRAVPAASAAGTAGPVSRTKGRPMMDSARRRPVRTWIEPV